MTPVVAAIVTVFVVFMLLNYAYTQKTLRRSLYSLYGPKPPLFFPSTSLMVGVLSYFFWLSVLPAPALEDESESDT